MEFYIATFNEQTEQTENLYFASLAEAKSFAVKNGYSKVRDNNGGQYHI